MNKLFGYFILLLFLFVFSEVFSYLVLNLDVGVIQSRIYRPPSATEEEFTRYLDQRDPDLGWPTKDWLAEKTDSDGARLSPANVRLNRQLTCISTYGDSFTEGAEVNDSQAWTNVLAEYLGCPVKNYGVGGYGVDQAILRFEKNANDFANFTILGFFVDNLNRNVNQWRYLISDSAKFGFKPAFTLAGEDKLQLLPIVVNSLDDFLKTAEAPGKMLKAEMNLLDGPSLRSKTRLHFPYSRTLLRLVLKVFGEINWQKITSSTRMREWNFPNWYDNSDGPNVRKTDLNLRLIEYFGDVCGKRKRRCAILAIPDVDSIRSYQVDGTSLMGRIVNTFRQHGDVWDATSYLAENTRDKGLCYYIGQNRDCVGHYNKEGYKLLAQFVADKVREYGWR